MQVEIDFRDMPPSPALERRIRGRAAKLAKFCDDILRCHVVVEAPHRHHHRGQLYHVKVMVSVPGGEIVINRSPAEDRAHEDAYVAVRDAFDAARRKLEDHVRRRRADVKHHEPQPRGRVCRIYPIMDYGMIEAPDGREIYFHRNSVIGGDFDRLEVGTEVRFAEEPGDLGPHATTVHVVGRLHHAATD
jgi:ribosome-associated translation inhibitor RaiA